MCAPEKTFGRKENVKCSATFLLRNYLCQNQNIACCIALQKMRHEKLLWYFIAASLTTNIFGECYLHVAFLNVSLWAKKREGFWGEGMSVIIAMDLVWKPDCFSDIQSPKAAESQTRVLHLTAFMFEELILFFKSWNLSLKQAETIRTYKICSLSQFHKQKSRKETKNWSFQNVSNSDVHGFPFVTSVHCSLKYLDFCGFRTISDACFSRGWPSNGCNYAHCAFFLCDNLLLIKLLSWAEKKFWLRRSLIR